MHIEIINTGSELLLGSVLNTHGAWMGQELMGLGLRVQKLITVPDGDAIRAALRESIMVSDVVIVTGGLGPTSDDITREATADALGVELIEDEHAVRTIESYFEKLGSIMTPSNLKQAQHPCGADVLPNPNGTAPGVYVPPRLGFLKDAEVRKNGCAIFLLPGPPSELRPMFNAEVAPRLKALSVDEEFTEQHGMTMLKFSGVGESRFQDALDSQLNAFENLEVGYCARPGELDLRLIGSAESREQASKLAREHYAFEYIGEGGDSLEAEVVKLLTEKGMKVTLAESCSGGRIASRITDVSGASSVFGFGFITYANEAKIDLVNVREDEIAKHGAVSKQVAMAMAEGALRRSDSDIAVSVTGIAGPTGGSEEKPVGTVWIGLSVRRGDQVETSAEMKCYPQGRSVFKELVSQFALMTILRTIR